MQPVAATSRRVRHDHSSEPCGHLLAPGEFSLDPVWQLTNTRPWVPARVSLVPQTHWCRMSTSTPQYDVRMCIYCASKIPNSISESCVMEIQPFIARVRFQATPQAHKPVPHSQLWSWDFGAGGVPVLPQTLLSPFREELQLSSPGHTGLHPAAATSPSTLPPYPPHFPPILGLRGPFFCPALVRDTDSSSWAVTAPAVRAADNTPSHAHGYQQCAATFSRVNMGKTQGWQSCWKTCLSAILQLTKTKY